MICLACDGENPYGRSNCTRCGIAFEIHAPFLNANHVSQLLVAMAHFSGGQMSRADLFRRVDAFLSIYGTLDQEWDFSQALEPRVDGALLADPPRVAEIAQSLHVLDQGMELLGLGIGHLETLREADGPRTEAEAAVLDQASEAILEFFRATCSGSAGLMHVLETSTSSADRLGSMIDIQVS